MSNSNPILQGLTSADPSLAPAINPPQGEPQVQPPLRRTDELSPVADAGQNQELPLHPVDHMAMAFMGNAFDQQKKLNAEATGEAPAAGAAPGSFGSKLRGALDAAAGGLGDASAAQGGDPHSGWLGAVGRVLNARTVRKTAEANTAFDKAERLKNDQINLAQANVAMRQHAFTMHRQQQEARQADASTAAQTVGFYRDNYDVKDGVNDAQLKQLASDPEWLKTHTAKITAYEPVLDAEGKPKMDSDGNQIETPLYSTINIGKDQFNQQHTVPAAQAKLWHDSGIKDVTAGTVMPVSLATKLDVNAQRFGSSLNLLNLAKVTPLPDDVKEQMTTALQDPMVNQAISMHPSNVLGGLYEAQDNMSQHLQVAKDALAKAQAAGDQNAVQQLQSDIKSHQGIADNLATTINQGFTNQERAAYQKEQEADRKQTEIEQQNQKRDAETERHNRNEEDIKRLEASGGTPGVLQNIGGKLADAEMVPSQLPKRAKNYDATWMEADNQSWQRYGKPYNGAQAEAEYKYYSNKTTQDTLKYINSLTGGPGMNGGNLGELVNKSNQIKRTEFPKLNDAAAWARLETGDPLIAQYKTVVTEVADQVAKILQGGTGGGGTSDAKMRQAMDMFATGFTKDQITGIAKELQPLLNNRQKGMIGNNRFLQKDYYGANGMTVTMVSPDGKQYTEVPMSQLQARQAQGARVATKQDYANLGIAGGRDH